MAWQTTITRPTSSEHRGHNDHPWICEPNNWIWTLGHCIDNVMRIRTIQLFYFLTLFHVSYLVDIVCYSPYSTPPHDKNLQIFCNTNNNFYKGFQSNVLHIRHLGTFRNWIKMSEIQVKVVNLKLKKKR